MSIINTINTINSIELPVSFGEAFDKLSILDIKLEKIKDQRRIEVEKEYNILQNKLISLMTDNVSFYYNILREINLNIWNIQDDIRLNNEASDKNKIIKGEICIKILDENDRRFRIKNKIDRVLSSNIKEQKGYPRKACFVLTNINNEQSITINGIIRYLTTVYDKVLVSCNSNNIKDLQLLYTDDPNIELFEFTCQEELKDYVTTSEIEIIDVSNTNSYLHMYIAKYFHVPDTKESDRLYSILMNDRIKDYIFIYSNSYKDFNNYKNNIDFIEKHSCYDKNNILYINNNFNIYEKDHKFYDLANKFVGKLIPEYKKIIKNSTKIYLFDTTILYMALNLDTNKSCNILIDNNITSINKDYQDFFATTEY